VAERPPRSTRSRPLRRLRYLALWDESGEGLVLERRPAAGIWGGLWMVPLAERGEGGRDDLAGAFAERGVDLLGTDQGVVAAEIVHTLTHRRIELRATRAALPQPLPRGWERLSRAALGERGVPTALVRLLAQIPTDPKRGRNV